MGGNILALIKATAYGFTSFAIACLSAINDSNATVPEPAKGSNIVSLGFVYVVINFLAKTDLIFPIYGESWWKVLSVARQLPDQYSGLSFGWATLMFTVFAIHISSILFHHLWPLGHDYRQLSTGCYSYIFLPRIIKARYLY